MNNLDKEQISELALKMTVGAMNLQSMVEILHGLDEKIDAQNYDTLHISVHAAMEVMISQLMSTYEELHRLMAAAKHMSTLEEACPDMETYLVQVDHGVELLGTLAKERSYGGGSFLDRANFPRHVHFCYLSLKHFVDEVDRQCDAIQQMVDTLPSELPLSVPRAEKTKKPRGSASKPTPELMAS